MVFGQGLHERRFLHFMLLLWDAIFYFKVSTFTELSNVTRIFLGVDL